jgi:hypothetical protein
MCVYINNFENVKPGLGALDWLLRKDDSPLRRTGR